MDYDLIIIGGGINGAGIARDAAGRGLKTLLVDAQDLGAATSSASTKLIHGGLRYLEQYDFKLVQESLHERERLLKAASHIIWPMKFVLPHHKDLRPYWMIKLGLKLYDFLAGSTSLPPSRAIHFKPGHPLKNDFKQGFSYSDCWVEDSRLVVLNAIDAYRRGAKIMPRTMAHQITPITDRGQSGWTVKLENMFTGDFFDITAEIVVNAAGPWVGEILKNTNMSTDFNAPNVRLVKGSHIIVRRLYDDDYAHILQQKDGRIIFAIPYEHNYTLIGTTDHKFDGDPANVVISDEEKAYLCQAVNDAFKKQITIDDIVWDYSGVRPLFDDGNANASKVTRDYKIHFDRDEKHGSAMFSIFGGKITTYRTLSEEVMNRVCSLFPDKNLPSWTYKTLKYPLPGGDFKQEFENFVQQKQNQYSFLPPDLCRRYCRAYGSEIDVLLKNKRTIHELGHHYGAHIYEAEIIYLVQYEFAFLLDDILWRRSKLGLHCDEQTKQAIEADLPRIYDIARNAEDYYESIACY